MKLLLLCGVRRRSGLLAPRELSQRPFWSLPAAEWTPREHVGGSGQLPCPPLPQPRRPAHRGFTPWPGWWPGPRVLLNCFGLGGLSWFENPGETAAARAGGGRGSQGPATSSSRGLASGLCPSPGSCRLGHASSGGGVGWPGSGVLPALPGSARVSLFSDRYALCVAEPGPGSARGRRGLCCLPSPAASCVPMCGALAPHCPRGRWSRLLPF